MSVKSMSESKYQHKPRNGQPFFIYALVCPRTQIVRYVGQSTTTPTQRLHNHTAYHHEGAMRDWLIRDNA
jgi:hypothetical protein